MSASCENLLVSSLKVITSRIQRIQQRILWIHKCVWETQTLKCLKVGVLGQAGEAGWGRSETRAIDAVPAVAPVDPVAMENQVANPTQQKRVWYTLRLRLGTGVEKWYKCWWLLLSSHHHQRGKNKAAESVPTSPSCSLPSSGRPGSSRIGL